MGAYAVDKFKRGFSGLMGLTGVPLDAMSKAVNSTFLRGVPVEPGGGKPAPPAYQLPENSQERIQKGWENITGYQGTPPPSQVQKYLVGGPAEFAGGSALPSGAVISMARRPVLAAATEAASTVGGGLGMEAGAEVGGAVGRSSANLVGGDKDTGEATGRAIGGLAGGVGGGSASAMFAPRVAAKGAEAASKLVGKTLKDDEEIRRATNSLFTGHFRSSVLSDPRWKANTEEALKTKAKIPGFEPDLGMATGTPAVKAMQTAAEAESPSAAARGVVVREKARKALADYQAGNFPAGERTLQELSSDELGGLEAALGVRQAKLTADLDRLKNTVRTGQFGPQEGQELAQLKAEQMKAAQGQADTRYQDVYGLANRLGFQGSLDPVVGYINRYLRDPNRVAQDKPGFLSDILSASKTASMQTKRQAMKALFDPAEMPQGLVEWISKNGGIRKVDAGGELPDVGRTPVWARRGQNQGLWLVHNGPTAKSLDHVLENAKEAGYLPKNADLNALTAAIDDEIRAGEAQHFSSRDWDRAAELQAKRAAEIQAEAGAGDVGHNAAAQFPASFGGMHSILKRIREEQRWYGSKQTDEARLAMRPLRELEAIVQGEIAKSGGEVSQRLASADEFFKTTVSDPFYRGVAARTFNDRGLIEDVGNRLLRRGEEGAKNFREVFGSSERADDLLWNGVLDSLSRRIGEGEVTSQRVRAFYEDHRKFLDQFPEIRTRLFAVDKVADGLETRAAEIGGIKRAVARDLVSTLTGRNDPEAFLLSVVGNESAMKNVAAWARKNPDLGKEIARTYVEGLSASKGGLATLLENEKTLKPVFDAVGPGQWDKVKTLLEGRKILARGAPDPVHNAPVVEDPLKAISGTGTSGIFSRIRGAVYRQISPAYVLVDIGGKYFFRVHKERARELINEALYDPKLIDQMLSLEHQMELPKPDYAKIGELMQEMKPHYATHGLRLTVGAFNDAQQSPEERRSSKATERALQRHWATGH